MGGIAGIVDWQACSVEESEIGLMLQSIRHRGTDGLNWETDGRVGFGCGWLALQTSELRDTQPVWLPDKSCGIVADARLYNRELILSRLGKVRWLRERPSDASILLAAYERWNDDLFDFLDGDFAFAIWDRKRDRLLAARDPFAAKPFFYCFDGRRFVFGSEPKQLLILPHFSLELDDMVIGEYLFGGNFEDVEHTFFKHILRLKPGNYIVATQNGLDQRRYWNPNPACEVNYSTDTDYLERFRELFMDAVAKRLRTDFPVAAQLSGGLDSSSIAVAAAEIYLAQAQARPLVTTISAIFPGLPCDESEYVQAVVDKVPFASRTIAPLSESLMDGLSEDMWQIDAPFADICRGLFVGCARIMHELGARTLFTGLGGDELIHENLYLRDLVLKKQFHVLLSESIKGLAGSPQTFWWFFVDALRFAVPQAVKRRYRKLRGARNWQPPEWANPSFVDRFRRFPAPPPLPEAGFKSLTQEMAFRWLNYPNMAWVTEALDCRGAFHSFSVAHPFLDRPLAEYVFAIPFEKRIPGGHWKYLLTKGLAGELPSKVRDRSGKASFDSFGNRIMEDWKSRLIEALFGSHRWLSERYVVQTRARALFESNCSVHALTTQMWTIATLELWLRQLTRYRSVKFERVSVREIRRSSL